MTIGTKIDLKTDSFAVFESSHLVTKEQYSSCRTAFDLPIHVSISLIPSFFIRKYHPKVLYLNLSSCSSALPLACSVHWLVFLERRNTSVFLDET